MAGKKEKDADNGSKHHCREIEVYFHGLHRRSAVIARRVGVGCIALFGSVFTSDYWYLGKVLPTNEQVQHDAHS